MLRRAGLVARAARPPNQGRGRRRSSSPRRPGSPPAPCRRPRRCRTPRPTARAAFATARSAPRAGSARSARSAPRPGSRRSPAGPDPADRFGVGQVRDSPRCTPRYVRCFRCNAHLRLAAGTAESGSVTSPGGCPAVPQQPDRTSQKWHERAISVGDAFAEGTLALADANSCYNFGRGIGRESDDGGQVAGSIPLPGRHGQQTRESVTMATFHVPTRRLILAGGFAVAVAAAPAVAMFAVPTTGSSAPSISACAGGEKEDVHHYCVPPISCRTRRSSQHRPVGGPDFRRSTASPAPAGRRRGPCVHRPGRERREAAGPRAAGSRASERSASSPP